ncbi:hypothetical protein L1889_08200 [Paenalcaligenes niemegkensis]|uniref:MFS transporter n=1 Tax=Paenalcaligenes niemegkensis TaxID=2895469 RepID=UPI001EE81616|nr:MFS transporter [Paenalcaligenes niemegkensis]MCQ9616695.1 hypothetical protein [Paenalcaligenes niemegkensis]
MGSNSLLYYVLISWLPSILTSSGYSAAEAGSLHGMMQLATALPGLFLGPIISRLKDQRLIAVGTTALMTIAILGLMWSPQFAIVWVFMFGLGSCSVIILSFVFMSLRANNSHQTAALSGMAQSVGYLLAATGPSLAGLVHQQLHSWTMPLSAGVVLTLVMMIVGAKAGRAGSMVT